MADRFRQWRSSCWPALSDKESRNQLQPSDHPIHINFLNEWIRLLLNLSWYNVRVGRTIPWLLSGYRIVIIWTYVSNFNRGIKLRHERHERHERHDANRQYCLDHRRALVRGIRSPEEGSSESCADLLNLVPEFSRYLWKLASPRPSLAFHQLHNNSQPLSFNNSLFSLHRVYQTLARRWDDHWSFDLRPEAG